jgi:hypothetical protein
LGDGMEARAAATGQDDSLPLRCRSHPAVASPNIDLLQHERPFVSLRMAFKSWVLPL